MDDLRNIPTAEIEFNKRGAIHDEEQIRGLFSMVRDRQITDLLVLGHGWNNDREQARSLYVELLESIAGSAEKSAALNGRALGVLATLWPSKKFAEKDLIPSGAAGLADPIDDQDLILQLALLEGGFDVEAADDILLRLAVLVPKLELSNAARNEFVELARGLIDPTSLDEELGAEVPNALYAKNGDEILTDLARPLDPMFSESEDGAVSLGTPAGGPAGFGVLGGIRAGAQRVLNLLTFYQMKARAGKVGENGMRTLLEDIRARFPNLKLHLVGHSFGGRLVTAAVRGPEGSAPITVQSLTLLQAAFSHHGLASLYDGTHDGYFRRVIVDHEVSGPVLVTFTSNDWAVGLAYPLAARLAGQDAAGVGGRDDPFGGIGRNGAVKTPEARDDVLLDTNGAYEFVPGTVHNLRASEFIKNHGDVTGPEVAHAIASAIAVT